VTLPFQALYFDDPFDGAVWKVSQLARAALLVALRGAHQRARQQSHGDVIIERCPGNIRSFNQFFARYHVTLEIRIVGGITD
jgi:hypothetical protein